MAYIHHAFSPYYLSLNWEGCDREFKIGQRFSSTLDKITNDVSALRKPHEKHDNPLSSSSIGGPKIFFWGGTICLLAIPLPIVLSWIAWDSLQLYSWFQLVFDFSAVIGASILAITGIALLRRGQALAQPTGREAVQTDQRPPIMFLRSFGNEDALIVRRNFGWITRLWGGSPYVAVRFEEMLASRMGQLGPFVAIGEPGEPIPEIGASRDYLDDDKWRSMVLERLDECSLNVIVPDTSDAVQWELKKVFEMGYLPKTFIMMPPPQPTLNSGLITFVPYASSFARTNRNLDRCKRIYETLATCSKDTIWNPAFVRSLPVHTLLIYGDSSGELVALTGDVGDERDYAAALEIAIYDVFCDSLSERE